MKTILTGLQPSGKLHIGNYFGSIKQILDLQNNNDNNLFLFVASYHALTTVKNRNDLKNYIKESTLDLLALGIDYEKSTFFIQSDVPQVLELSLLLSNITSMGLLERSHAYKDKITKGIQANHGLFSYPILMAADILLYNADIVPVGKDQIQHLEITRDIVKSFNSSYGNNILKEPKELINDYAIINGIDGKKMSKSYKNTIDIFNSPNIIKKQVNSIITTSTPIDEIKDFEYCQIFNLAKLFMNTNELENLKDKYLTPGFGYGHFKKDLLDSINKYFEPFKEKRIHLEENPKFVKEIMEIGKNKASKEAEKNLNKIKDIVGL